MIVTHQLGTCELRTPWDHAKVSTKGRCPFTENAPGNVMTFSSCHMQRIQKLDYREALDIEEWTEIASVQEQ